MYVPSQFREEDRDMLLAFMRQHGFATVVSVSEGRPMATHLPVTVAGDGEGAVLRGHFARANPQWRALEQCETLVIFTGPHAYVSPEHYERRESVPTWNYLAVHAYGQARLVEADAAVEGLLAELIADHEPAYGAQWESLPERYREGMKRGIVGFEMPVARLEGAAKLSQNKTEGERRRIASALSASADAAARATGEEMARRLRAAEQET